MDKLHGLFPVLRIHETFLNEKPGDGGEELQQSAYGFLKGNEELLFPYLTEESANGGGIVRASLNPFEDEQPQDAEGTVGHGGVEAAALILIHEAEEVLHVVEVGLNGEASGVEADNFPVA